MAFCVLWSIALDFLPFPDYLFIFLSVLRERKVDDSEYKYDQIYLLLRIY